MTSRPTTDEVLPTVRVDLDAIRDNARAVSNRFDGRIVGVTKAVTGDPAIAHAMLEGGVDGIGDSRLLNLQRVGEIVDTERTLLVPPGQNDIERLLSSADRSLHSAVKTISAVAATAREHDRTHDIILMVDTGDRREGVLPENLVATLKEVSELEGIRVVGLGTNLGCFGGVLPTADAMVDFVSIIESTEMDLSRTFHTVSGGSTVTLPLVEEGTLPKQINELRIGEAILLGTDVARNREIPFLRQDGFTLQAEVIECKHKPSIPTGPQGHDIDGTVPEFEDRGRRKRAVLALGKQDTVLQSLVPLSGDVEILGGSSDHTICDVTDADRVSVGDTLEFRLQYRALVQAFTSEYVSRSIT